MRCEWQVIGGKYQCTRCGWSIDQARVRVLPLIRTCDLTPPPPWYRRHRGLGDTVAAVLARMGVKEKKKKCGCRKRQEVLNRIAPYNWQGLVCWTWIFYWLVSR